MFQLWEKWPFKVTRTEDSVIDWVFLNKKSRSVCKPICLCSPGWMPSDYGTGWSIFHETFVHVLVEKDTPVSTYVMSVLSHHLPSDVMVPT